MLDDPRSPVGRVDPWLGGVSRRHRWLEFDLSADALLSFAPSRTPWAPLAAGIAAEGLYIPVTSRKDADMPDAAPPVADELIELRGLRFHYRDWTSRRDGAPDLVLLHGFTGHARSWDAFAEAMTDRYRVLALDQRGHGESGWAAADAYGNPEMVEDVAAFVAAMGLKRFSLLGLSMGGMVAINYAGRRPKGLAELVIVDIGPEIVAAGSARIQSGVRAADVFATRDEAFAAARTANSRPPEAHHRQRVGQNLMRTEDCQASR